MVIGGVAVVLAAVAIVVAVAAWPEGEKEPQIAGGGDALARELGLQRGGPCGKETTVFHPTKDSDGVKVFALRSTWFHVRKCLAPLLSAAIEKPDDDPMHRFLEAQVLYVLSRRPVQFYSVGKEGSVRLKDLVAADGTVDVTRFDRIAYVNRNGVAHNSMSQAEIGVWFVGAARRMTARGLRPETAALYEAFGLAALRVILDPIDARGLRSGGPCALRPEFNCAWYHAVTNPTRESSEEGER